MIAPDRRLRADAVWIGVALTFAFGAFGHAIVEAVADGGSFDGLTPSHVTLLVVATLAVMTSLVRVGGYGASRERRRRLALVRRELRADTPAFFAAAASGQVLVAAAILFGEHVAVAPGHLVATIVSAILSVLVGTLVLRVARRRLVAVLLSWIVEGARAADELHTLYLRAKLRTNAALPYLRTLPGRAPPALLTV